MAIQLPIAPTEHEAYHLAEHRIRRCTYRRLIAVDATHERMYEAECLYPKR